MTDTGRRARAAARTLATAVTAQKDTALKAIADAILSGRTEIGEANDKDLAELPEVVKKNLNIVTVETMDDVLKHALVRWTAGPGGSRKTNPQEDKEADGLSTFC